MASTRSPRPTSATTSAPSAARASRWRCRPRPRCRRWAAEGEGGRSGACLPWWLEAGAVRQTSMLLLVAIAAGDRPAHGGRRPGQAPQVGSGGRWRWLRRGAGAAASQLGCNPRRTALHCADAALPTPCTRRPTPERSAPSVSYGSSNLYMRGAMEAQTRPNLSRVSEPSGGFRASGGGRSAGRCLLRLFEPSPDAIPSMPTHCGWLKCPPPKTHWPAAD